MADIIRERERTSGVAWVALILAIIALVIAIVAYNRSGENLDETIRDGASEAIDSLEEAGDDVGEGASDAVDSTEEAIDEGPDGVDDGTR